MKHLLIIVFVAGVIAQTATPTHISTGQVVPTTATTSPSILIYYPSSPNTGFNLAVFDSSIVLDKTTTPWTLRAVTTLPTWTSSETTAVTAPLSTLTLKNQLIPGTEKVYRNGVRLSPGVDYTAVGNVLTFVAGQTPGPGDNLLVDYRSK